MSYKPMTADEAARLNLRPEGTYAFEVVTAANKTSKKGDPMIALSLNLFDADGSRFAAKDWLVHSDNRWSEKKFFDFANTTGLTDKYAAGTLCAEDCQGRGGFAAVGIEKGKPREDGTGSYPDRNVVKYYVASKPDAKKKAPTEAQLANTGSDSTEDVPF